MPPPLYPILLDVTDRLCVIIGGGAVAVRKARGLIAAGAVRVHMIAPMISADVPEQVRQVRECYRPEHIEQAGIVFAATNVAEVNDTVVRDARARGILVSRADSDDEFPGDFVTPARFDRGPATICVSAGSAALSVMIRDGLAARWDSRWTDLAQAMAQLRPEIKQRWSEAARREIFHELASAEAMDVLGAAGVEGLRDWIKQRHLEDRGPATGPATGAGT